MNFENQNKIIISNHASQRREDHNSIDKDILINLVEQIDYKYNISKNMILKLMILN